MSTSDLRTKPGTLATSVYEQIRRDIVQGNLLPGAKLRVETLRERYQIGGSPIREALNRLSSDGMVSQHDQRGFAVLPVSVAELEELTRTRLLVNGLVLRESIAKGDVVWEENVVLALHRLSRTPKPLDGEGRDKAWEEWEGRHRAFHSALIAACGSRWLLSFSEMLFDEADRYRHIGANRVGTPRDNQSEHGEIAEAVIARDADRAVALLNAHVRATAAVVLDVLGMTLDKPAKSTNVDIYRRR